MNNEQDTSFDTAITTHKVDIFHFCTFFRYTHISCKECKLEYKCRDETEKNQTCLVAKDAEKQLKPFTLGRVYKLNADEFYLYVKYEDDFKLKEIINSLKIKFMKKKYVR